MAEQPEWVAHRCPQCGGTLSATSGHVVCRFCGTHLTRVGPAGPGGAAGQEPVVLAEGMHLKAFTYVDAQGLGMEAFRLLLPAGWTFEGGMEWSLRTPSQPGAVSFRVRNPDGLEVLQAFPSLPFFWSNNPMVRMSLPMGGMYMGYEVRPPAPVTQVLQEVVLPRCRGQMVGLQFMSQQPLLGLPAQAPDPVSGAPTTAEGAKLRVRYRQSGQIVEEELYGLVEVAHVYAPTMMGMVENLFWQADYLFSFGAQSDRLDALSALFETIVRSFRVNVQWFNRFVQVVQYLVQNQIQQVAHAGQLRQIASQVGSYVPEPVMALYRRQHEIRQRMADGIGQGARGMEVYQVPSSGETAELPAGYAHAWANAQGEYVLTDDARFNPNLGSDGGWQHLSRLS